MSRSIDTDLVVVRCELLRYEITMSSQREDGVARAEPDPLKHINWNDDGNQWKIGRQ